jgi:signal transduction histidine kinase
MKGRVRLPLFLVALALLGLIGLLATLQYRWLGRISEAERDRMRATLESGASAFAKDFDAELTRAYLLFQTDPIGETEDRSASFVSRFERWHATSKFPRLIRNAYAFTPGDNPRLERFDPATGTFTAIEWPESMRDWRVHLLDGTSEEASTTRGGSTFFIRRMPSPVWDTVPAIVVPSPRLIVGDTHAESGERMAPRLTYTILELDEDYISREILPALAEEHFTRSSGATFQVAVVSRARGGRVIYHSSDAFNPTPGAHADLTADLLSVRTQDFSRVASEVHRFATFATTMKLKAAAEGGPPKTPAATDKRHVAVGIEPDPARGQPALRTTTSALVNAPDTPAAWQLILTHQSGSLEAAVDTVRRRNLVVSFSILGVLGASMGLLIMTTRRAQRLAQQQMEFVATVSHELRTPLAVIRSAAENLADGIIEDKAQVRTYGELVRGEGRRLTDMVEQILEFSGIQSGERRLNASQVALGPLVQDVIDASASLTSAAGIGVEVDLPADLHPVLGDEPALGRVFQNLFANAIKYGAAGGWIGVEAHQHGDDVLVTISDRGMGIEASDQPRVFEPFYRAPAVVAAQIHGAGLGLSLVQRIVQAHGGTVTVRSAPGAGAAFTVQLPVATSERARRAAVVRRTATPPGSGAKAPNYS